MTTFKVLKNVDKNFSLTVSDEFIEMYSIGSMNVFPVARIRHPITVSANPPSLKMFGSMAIDIPISFSGTTGSIGYTPASDITVYATTANCVLYEGGSFSVVDSANGYMGMGSYIADGARGDKAWLPFDNITYNSGQTIISAILTLTSSETRARDYVNVKMGCENFTYTPTVDVLDSPPTNYDNLNKRIMTQAVSYFNGVEHWTINSQYSFNITSSVQEILNNPNWVSGHALAVMIFNNASDGNQDREFWGAGNATTLYKPTLFISV